ncbi:MAG: glycoside hydrolase family 99-like domain-containing protein [Acidimicrobiaceae bacterium]|nr:glycoside hydrolase family 99-like domain-containing protein [Acidimicrobiaceae bacterium]
MIQIRDKRRQGLAGWLAPAVAFALAVLALPNQPAAAFRASAAATLTPPSPESPLVGAYYSDWYPSNAAQGTLRAHLSPPQGPSNAALDDADPAVAAKAIAQASQAGVDFFALDYWPNRPAQNANIDAFLKADDLADIKFCIFYETWDTPSWDGPEEATVVTPALEATFDANLTSFAQRYFDNPSYLRVDDRPVVVLYLTRTLAGDVAGMITGARSTLENLGYNPYFIGDEIFWRVTDENLPATGSPLTHSPQTARIWDFDAITSYGLFAGGHGDPLSPQGDFKTYPGLTSLAADELSLYRRYAAATRGEVPVIPDATPGENTRAVRRFVEEHAEPRQWTPGAGPASTLVHYLDDIDRPIIDPRAPLLFVTTWNEWNEDTGIQPVGGTPTARDDSRTGKGYSQGYVYGGEGDADLVAIRNFVAIAWGRAVPHTAVTATRDGVVVSATRANSLGWYVLRRAPQATGKLTVTSGVHHQNIQASGGRATRIDFDSSAGLARRLSSSRVSTTPPTGRRGR